MPAVNYNQIASNYDERYQVNQYAGIEDSLLALLKQLSSNSNVLEVGCGTGHWLHKLSGYNQQIVGVDLSLGMLQKAQVPLRNHSLLVCANADSLPFADTSFDLIYCVNAFHHFRQPELFLAEARRILRTQGVLAIIGMNPHAQTDKWYLYDYFEETLAIDMARFPAYATLYQWLQKAGFNQVESVAAEKIQHRLVGKEIWSDHFLQKGGTSQLTLLSQEAYDKGITLIKQALSAKPDLFFDVDITLTMVVAR